MKRGYSWSTPMASPWKTTHSRLPTSMNSANWKVTNTPLPTSAIRAAEMFRVDRIRCTIM